MALGIYTDVRSTDGTPVQSGQQPKDAAQEQPAAPGASRSLLELDDKAVFAAIDQTIEGQEPLAKNREAARKHRARVRRGVPFSTLKKDEERGIWTAELPPGVSENPAPIPNRADDLCRKIVSQVIVDLPLPDPKPATDSEQDRGAADIAKKFLKADGDESGTNDPAVFRDCLDSAMTDASEFTHEWVDMTGGGWRPLRIKAHPHAQDPANPLVAVDPATGQSLPTADYILRYVTDAQQFTNNAAEAARQWMPKHRTDILGPQHVRTEPEMADVHTADAVILLCVGPLSDLKRRVPDIADWGADQVNLLASWKPRRHKALVPESLRARLKDQKDVETKGVHDDTLLFWYHKYCRVGPNYPDGAEIMVSGANGGLVLKRATLRTDVPNDDETVVLLRDIPVAQCRALIDSEHKDPFGRCPIDLFGQTGEGLAHLFGAVYEDTDKRLHPNVFTTSTSPVQDWQMTERSGRSIPVYSKDDMPMYEEFADLASFLPDVIRMLREDMDDAAGLGSAAQMLNTPDAVSGTAKQMELTQAKVALASVAQNFFTFVKRRWRLKLQLAQAYLTLPQQVEYSGIDAAYKQRWWTGADFAGVKDVAIQAGSGTLMSPAEKQQFVALAQGQAWLDPDEAAEVGRSTVADDLGVQSSPHEDSIRRELAQWSEGPPEPAASADPRAPPMPTWAEQKQAYDQEQAQIQQMAATAAAHGQPTQPPATATPAPWSPFLPRPTDEDPSVAKRQYKVLRDFIASSDYSKHDPAWRSLVDARFQQAMYAAGIQTVKQQAEAAAQQAAQQQQEKESDREFQRSEGDANRAAKAQPRMAA